MVAASCTPLPCAGLEVKLIRLLFLVLFHRDAYKYSLPKGPKKKIDKVNNLRKTEQSKALSNKKK